MRRRQVQGGAGPLHVVERGPATASPIVLVHGYPDTSALWDEVASRLEANHRVIAYDVRGAGRSVAPPRREDFAMAALVGDLAAVIDDVTPSGKVHLVGHDWGAIQGFAAAADPAVSARLASFTALCAPGLGMGRRFIERRLAAPSPRNITHLAGQLARSWYLGAFQLPIVPELAVRAIGAVGASPGTGDAADAVRGLELYRANRRGEAWRSSSPLGIPIQVVAARRDPFVSPRVFDDLAELPNVRITEVDAGHWLPRTRPDVVAAAVRGMVAEVEGTG